ncbi:peroxisomal dehydratase [Heliocybe sulcata]|uniref:Peroxisomal dehydratase n=1 Tax=Heliocybe sulcata TaxID=5364 RepID=A0A5C3NA10_9AGAM|nr:peroxisomal dehydratase [Heliocybe sulcata]
MSVDLAKVVGHQSPDKPVAWNKRDLLLYAVGIGAKKEDFPFVYELDKKFAPFPTYPVALGLKGEDQDVNSFAEKGKIEGAPGLPNFDLNRVVHGSQTIEILKPLPAVSGHGWKLKEKICGVHENKSGIIVDAETTLADGNGTAYARLYSSAFHIGSKVTGTKFDKVIAGPPQGKPIPKDRKPDWVVKDQTSPDQAIVYRLSGDYNPLHIDPRIGQAAGFGGIILHGLSTYGFAARALLSAIGGNDPHALKFFGCRFTSPVKPGDVLETSAWEVGPGPDGTIEVAFVTKNLTSGKAALGGGIAYIKKVEKSKL